MRFNTFERTSTCLLGVLSSVIGEKLLILLCSYQLSAENNVRIYFVIAIGCIHMDILLKQCIHSLEIRFFFQQCALMRVYLTKPY